MKSHTIAIFLAACLLFLAAHAGFGGMPAVQQGTSPAPDGGSAEPVYQLEPLSTARSFRSGARRAGELASCDYRLLTLSVANPEDLSPADLEAANRNLEAFNGRMAGLMAELEEYGAAVGGAAEEAYADGGLTEAYYDRAASSGAVMGQVVSVRMDRGGYTGGAHPNSYTSAFLFDLETGQFIPDPAQLADDPAAFQAAAAEKLVEKAEAIRANRSAYWQDYAEIISHWNEGTVLFDEEGMLVVYSTYELGPYAMGAVELRLDWEELAELMGPAALARLGVEQEGPESVK